MAPNKKNTVQNSTYVAQSSPLLLLCPETRNRIFEFVCEGTVMQYQRMTGSQPAYHEVENYFDGKPEPPGFLLVCKQLYYESIGVSLGIACAKSEKADCSRCSTAPLRSDSRASTG